MSPTILELEARAAAFARARWLTIIGVALVALFVLGSCWDSHRATFADGEIKVLEQQTAAAQRERHAATLQAIAARASLLAARQRADSLEHAATLAAARSEQLSRLVRVLSETTLVVQVTPSAPPQTVSVPHVVTEYIGSLQATIAAKDLALQARDTQTVRADTVVVTVDRIVHADSTVINSQAETVDAEKEARPRFGFKSGAALASIIALIIHFSR